MKKLLSLVLAVIMLLSIMPIAYAQRATYSPEIEEYIEDFIKACTYFRNIYETPEQQTEVRNILREAIGENTEIFPTYENLTNINDNGLLDELTVFHECLKKGIDEIEKKIADDEIAIVLDVYEACKCALYADTYYSDKDWKEIGDRAENFKSDKYIKAYNEAEIGVDIIAPMLGGFGDGPSTTTMTQAEFDAALAMVKAFYDLMFACLDGNHPYGEYISDNNATEEADGTKTATCDFCGATDTITDEGTKLPKEKASLLEMIFDLIKDFLNIIFFIFK